MQSQSCVMETALLLTPPLPLTLSLHGLWSSVLFEPGGGGAIGFSFMAEHSVVPYSQHFDQVWRLGSFP